MVLSETEDAGYQFFEITQEIAEIEAQRDRDGCDSVLVQLAGDRDDVVIETTDEVVEDHLPRLARHHVASDLNSYCCRRGSRLEERTVTDSERLSAWCR